MAVWGVVPVAAIVFPAGTYLHYRETPTVFGFVVRLLIQAYSR